MNYIHIWLWRNIPATILEHTAYVLKLTQASGYDRLMAKPT